ncbi:MAG: hypothetical protein NTX73_17605 [Rhodobacterales bacterium]|nr:hypothetical protein [Rhodobacterales bacterium]
MDFFNLGMGLFPEIDLEEEVVWAPLFISPIFGSPERLVAAVAVAGENNHLVSIAGQLQKLSCLYGDNSGVVIAATKSAISEFQTDLAERGKEALLQPKHTMQILSIGEAKISAAGELREIAECWLGSISSLHIQQDVFSLTTVTQQAATKQNVRGDQLSTEVCRVAAERKLPILKYFSNSIRGPKRTGPLSRIALDFDGRRVKANFSSIRPGRDVRGEFDRVYRRLWALDVSQVRAGFVEDDSVRYELILQVPFSELQKAQEDKVSSALDALTKEADEKRLILRPFSKVDEIVSHLSVKEAA